MLRVHGSSAISAGRLTGRILQASTKGSVLVRVAYRARTRRRVRHGLLSVESVSSTRRVVECWRRPCYGYPAVTWRALMWEEGYRFSPLVGILCSGGSRGAESRQQRGRGRMVVGWARRRGGGESLCRRRGLCSKQSSALMGNKRQAQTTLKVDCWHANRCMPHPMQRPNKRLEQRTSLWGISA